MQDTDLLPEGLEDRLPPAAAVAGRLTRAVLDCLDSYGYDRVQPPTIEFERSLASRMEGVQPRRMFRFVDPASLRTLALRSDMTPQLGRIASTSLGNAARPLRLCYAGQVVTIKGDGLDPAREHLQIGAELIGTESVAGAGEIVVAALEALHRTGATRLSIDFTLPDLVDMLATRTMPLAADQIAAVRRELDAKDAGGIVAAGGSAYLPLLTAIGPFAQAIEQLAAIDSGGVLAGRIAALRELAARVGDRARVTLDPSERHGFEYQTWFGFTIYAAGSPGIVGRGGSYSIRTNSAGAADEPAIGFSLYPDTLIESLTRQETPRDALFLPIGHEAHLAERLRAIGWRTIAALSDECDARALGCTHRLEQGEAIPL